MRRSQEIGRVAQPRAANETHAPVVAQVVLAHQWESRYLAVQLLPLAFVTASEGNHASDPPCLPMRMRSSSAKRKQRRKKARSSRSAGSIASAKPRPEAAAGGIQAVTPITQSPWEVAAATAPPSATSNQNASAGPGILDPALVVRCVAVVAQRRRRATQCSYSGKGGSALPPGLTERNRSQRYRRTPSARPRWSSRASIRAWADGVEPLLPASSSAPCERPRRPPRCSRPRRRNARRSARRRCGPRSSTKTDAGRRRDTERSGGERRAFCSKSRSVAKTKMIPRAPLRG